MKKFCVFIFFMIIVIGFNAYANPLIDRIKTMKPVTSYPEYMSVELKDTVTFGNYFNNMDPLVKEYYKEPVEWILVSRDDKNALLMSKYIIDSEPFNNEKPSFSGGKYYSRTGDYLSCDWKHSSLRRWMNDVLYNEMFNEAEKTQINTAYVDDTYILDYSTYEVLGNRSEDKIFLLNEKELFHYFGKNNAPASYVNRSTRGTEYAVKRKNLIYDIYDWSWSRGNGDYMLRPTGELDNKTILIQSNGNYSRAPHISESGHGVRPCIFIKLVDTVDMGRIKLDDDVRSTGPGR